MLKIIALMILLFPMFCYAADVEENIKQPLWEFGVGFGGSSLPQYIGSDERYAIPFVFPYLIYRGENWRVDTAGIKNKVVDSEKYTIELSLSGGLPVRNDNQARIDMPELLLNAEIGAKLNWYLSESEYESWIVRLPVRGVVDIAGKYNGWVIDPVLTRKYYHPVKHGFLKTYVDVGFQYNSSLYHETYYGVDTQYVTPNRAAYQAKQGLHSLFAKMWIKYPWSKKTEVFATLQARSLAAGVVSDSPLVKDNTYATLTLGAIWLFSTSDEMVRIRE
ncbi:MAG TPA: MipA/OmpV family protein [Ghiorsea sp.]|nr:MipA/OmpV family protein [Ghiorsea sp.]HIP07578.1 MipA/OmpV family protein [Mariprofundaceae bacterium]